MIVGSPRAAPAAGPAEDPGTRFAFFGRVSTDDVQDPSLSIPRQLGACEHAIGPAGGRVVAHYWDIESGRKELARRGHGADPAAFGVPVPRDGGLADLLAAAADGRPFDAVIVESIDRLSRMTPTARGSSATWSSLTCRCSPPTSRW